MITMEGMTTTMGIIMVGTSIITLNLIQNIISRIHTVIHIPTARVIPQAKTMPTTGKIYFDFIQA